VGTAAAGRVAMRRAARTCGLADASLTDPRSLLRAGLLAERAS
jgi:hypothetical protein